jgi:hypothetical protein
VGYLTPVFLPVEYHEVPDFIGGIILPGSYDLSQSQRAQQAHG